MANNGEHYRDFSVSACDLKGHSERITFRISPQLAAQAKRIVTSGKFPYDDVSDMVRHSLFKQIQWCGEAEKLETHVPYLRTMHEYIGEMAEQQEFQRLFDDLDRVVRYNMAEGHPDALIENVRLLNRIYESITKMPGSGYWKQKYLQMFNERYSNVLTVAPAVTLVEFDDDDPDDPDSEELGAP